MASLTFSFMKPYDDSDNYMVQMRMHDHITNERSIMMVLTKEEYDDLHIMLDNVHTPDTWNVEIEDVNPK